MVGNRVGADIQFTCDLLVGETLADQGDDLELPFRDVIGGEIVDRQLPGMLLLLPSEADELHEQKDHDRDRKRKEVDRVEKRFEPGEEQGEHDRRNH